MKRKKFDWSKYGIFFAWIILVAGFTVCESSFLTINNILNILRQVSIVGISAVGMTFIILSGGSIDWLSDRSFGSSGSVTFFQWAPSRFGSASVFDDWSSDRCIQWSLDQ